MNQSYNLRSPAVKRIMKEAQELCEPTYEYAAKPLEDNLFEWHFTFRGPESSEFEGGIYHGRIILPPEYPMKPPSIILLNANGRFEMHTKICLSISGYHPETWQPSWSIRTAILAIIGFMTTKGEGSIGALDYSAEERKILAKKSIKFCCTACGNINDLILSEKPSNSEQQNTDSSDLQDTQDLVSKIKFVKEKSKTETSKPTQPKTPITEASSSDEQKARTEKDCEDVKADKPLLKPTETSAPTTSTQPIPSDAGVLVRRGYSSDTVIDLLTHSLVVFLAILIGLLLFRRLGIIFENTK